MIINPLSALQGLPSQFAVGGPASAPVASVAAGSFADLVSNGVTSTMQSLRGAEATSLDALQGKAETRQVVDAIMSAEQSLQAAIAIRDKIVTSYLEVSRMQI